MKVIRSTVVGCVKPGPQFGQSAFLTPQGDEPERENLVWSPDGKILAFGKQLPTFDADGNHVYTYKGEDLKQIFIVDFPDADGDGIAGKMTGASAVTGVSGAEKAR